MKKQNYLEKIPLRRPDIVWSSDEEGKVTLEIENRGVFNRIAQKLLKKPPVSYIHLDTLGSFIWPIIDGERNVDELSREVDAKFGEEAHPLYERLIKFLEVLASYNFIKWK